MRALTDISKSFLFCRLEVTQGMQLVISSNTFITSGTNHSKSHSCHLTLLMGKRIKHGQTSEAAAKSKNGIRVSSDPTFKSWFLGHNPSRNVSRVRTAALGEGTTIRIKTQRLFCLEEATRVRKRFTTLLRGSTKPQPWIRPFPWKMAATTRAS